MPEITVTDYDGLEIDAESRAVTVTLYDGQPAHDLPTGGTTNQVLAKASDADYDVVWADDGVGGGSLVTVDADGTVTVDGTGVELATDAQLAAHTHDDRYYTETEVDTALASNATADRARANHTGTQTSATISDFDEAVQDAVAALLAAGTAISLSYDDAGNSLTITGTGGSGGLDAEAVRDAIGVALIGSGLISVTVNDEADTITISTTATANSTDAQLRDRATHTGTQTASTITGLAAVATTGAYADLSGKPTIPDSADDIGAASATHNHAAGDIASGTIATARLGSGTADSTTFLRGDNTWATPAGGSSSSPWTLTVDNPLTSMTGFTAGLGTWSASASGIRQASTAANRPRLYLDQLVQSATMILQVEINVASMSSTTTSRGGILVGAPLTGDTTISGADQIALQSNGSTTALARVHQERDNATNGADIALSPTIAVSTWTTLRLAKAGLDYAVWVNGTLLGALRAVHSTQVLGRFALVTESADVTFRNLKIWTPTLPS